MVMGSLGLRVCFRAWSFLERSGVVNYPFYRFFRRIFDKVNHYFTDRPSALFVIPFMVMMILCAVFIAAKRENTAEDIADWAYITIVFGVLLDFIHMMVHRSSEDRQVHDSR